MNQQIIDYLQQNRNQYTKESLIEQLRKAGHNVADITEAVKIVYGDTDVLVSLSDNSVENEVKYAGFWIRFAAMFIDGIILTFGFVFLVIPLVLIIGDGISSQIAIQLFIFVVTVLYFVFMTNKYQATLGKKAVGVKVCDANTLEKTSSGHIIIREVISRLFMTIPPLFLLHSVVAFAKRKQGLHDMAAKTVVVYKDPNQKRMV